MRCLLFFLRDKKPRFKPQSGFTLLEMLVVITVLGLIAGVAVLGLNGVTDQSRADTTNFEMAELRKALLQFRRDSGSRDFPTQGVYDCTDSANGGLITDINSNFPLSFSASVAAMSNAEFIIWCQSPENFWMLFIDPFERPTQDQWNEDTRRGWNGPYLQNKYGAVSNSSIDTIPSVITPYQTPYLLFDLSTANASIISMGENDTLGAISACSSGDDDDYVLCLLK
jgi:prepilin-type N-terminal cleavage/methylation domain-containing protein